MTLPLHEKKKRGQKVPCATPPPPTPVVPFFKTLEEGGVIESIT